MRSILATLLLSLLAFAPSAAADGAALVTFTGELVDGESRPISGVFPVQFRLYEAENGGDALWTEARFVSVAEGMYEVQLGANEPVPAELYGRTLFVGVELGAAGEISRTPLLIAGQAAPPTRDEVIAGLDIIWADLADRAVQSEEALEAEDCVRVGGKTLEEIDRFDELLAQLVSVREEVTRATRATVGGRTTTLERIGGGGGLPYARNCPPNHVVVGIRGGAGDLIDSIELVCAPLE